MFPLGASSKTGTICFYNIVASCGWFLKRGGSDAEINDQSQLPHHIELSTFFKKSKISDRKEKRKSSILEGDLLPPYRAIQQKIPSLYLIPFSRIRPTLTVSFNLKWILHSLEVSVLTNTKSTIRLARSFSKNMETMRINMETIMKHVS